MTSPKIDQTRAGFAGDVWRPVQYLGSKLRSLESIVEAVAGICEPGSAVWDPFTGSSVVAQALAASGRRIVAHDTQHAAATFASALLGVGRDDLDESPRDASDRMWGLVTQMDRDLEAETYSFWAPWLAAEDEAILSKDAGRLIEVSSRLPQRWKSGRASKGSKPPVDSAGPGFASTFAGTYFGLRQALRLDSLRVVVDHLETEQMISAWERDVLLTSLCHAASAAVFSAGKHFAQPLRATNGNRGFSHDRLLRDRSLDIDGLVRSALLQAATAARPSSEGHLSARQDVLEVATSYLVSEGIQCVYADPPYTAQQYSRFYHVLELLIKGESEPLQVWRGAITRGLYANDRYRSPFSSVTQAPDAFRRLLRTVADAGSGLVLSYSASGGTDSGNARMVKLDELRGWLSDVYGPENVEVARLSHTYRQFNASDLAMADRDAPEYLLTAFQR